MQTGLGFSEAKRQFDIRYYLWGTSEFEKEIEASFPTLRLFKAGGAWKTYQLMLQLPKSEQLVLARSLLKRSHPNAVKSLGETCSSEEDALLSRRDAAFSNIVSFGEEIQARKKAGECIKLAGKAKLRKVMTAQFKATFGSECFELACVDEEEELRFNMKRAGWFVTTSFYFGRSKPVLGYTHRIASEEPLVYRPGIGPMVVGAMMSFNSCLGISRTEWHYITEEEIESTCNTVIKLCAHFFDVLPKLLKGLECDSVVPDGADIRGF
jgi:hypothetical protein